MLIGKSIKEFCVGRFSVPTFYARRKRGLAPEVIYIPGQQKAIITAKAERDWEKKIQSKEAQRLVKRERELRSAQARLAGQKAAAVKAAKRKAAAR